MEIVFQGNSKFIKRFESFYDLIDQTKNLFLINNEMEYFYQDKDQDQIYIQEEEDLNAFQMYIKQQGLIPRIYVRLKDLSKLNIKNSDKISQSKQISQQNPILKHIGNQINNYNQKILNQQNFVEDSFQEQISDLIHSIIGTQKISDTDEQNNHDNQKFSCDYELRKYGHLMSPIQNKTKQRRNSEDLIRPSLFTKQLPRSRSPVIMRQYPERYKLNKTNLIKKMQQIVAFEVNLKIPDIVLKIINDKECVNNFYHNKSNSKLIQIDKKTTNILPKVITRNVTNFYISITLINLGYKYNPPLCLILLESKLQFKKVKIPASCIQPQENYTITMEIQNPQINGTYSFQVALQINDNNIIDFQPLNVEIFDEKNLCF